MDRDSAESYQRTRDLEQRLAQLTRLLNDLELERIQVRCALNNERILQADQLSHRILVVDQVVICNPDNQNNQNSTIGMVTHVTKNYHFIYFKDSNGKEFFLSPRNLSLLSRAANHNQE